MRLLQWALLAGASAVMVACSSDGSGDITTPQEKTASGSASIQVAPTALQTKIAAMNVLVKGRHVAVGYAEYLTSGESAEQGSFVLFNNRGNKQLSGDFLPITEYCPDGTTDISYYIDQNRPSADLPVGTTSAAIGRAMTTWSNVTCATVPIYRKASDAGISTGFVSNILGYGGSFEYVADVVHCGWLPAAFFEAVRPGGSTSILGVTFTLFWVDEDGNATDVDKDGNPDVGFREIYYNDGWIWRTNGQAYDVEYVALHEAGHGLSQNHFGKAFYTYGNGKWHFAPFAVMNAVYAGAARVLQPTDEAGHCSIWANWPKR